MAEVSGSPQHEAAPPEPVMPATISQKRALEDDHSPAVSSPLNPDVKPTQRVQIQTPDEAQAAMSGPEKRAADEPPVGKLREKRTKKDSLKKRESKGVVNGAADSTPRATPDRQHRKDVALEDVAPLRYKLAPPKPTDFEQARGPVFTNHHEVQDSERRTIEFFETSEHVYNKKNFHYTHCIADPSFPSMFYYRQTEPEPYGAHVSFEDCASHNMFFDKSGTHVTSDKGFRTARANVAVREGRWYWECKVTQGILKQRGDGDPENHGHVRIGWARREASLDAPVGFDAYSYGIRDVAGQKVHMSRPADLFPPGEDIQEGDVIGLEIQLPSERLHRKVVQGEYNPAVDLDDENPEPSASAANIVRDRIPIRFKAHIYFERIDYHTTKELDDLMHPITAGQKGKPSPHHALPALRTLPNSHIKIYKNGKLIGTPFTDLLAFLPPASRMVQQPAARDSLDDGSLGYYPAVSVFRGGAAELNFGPNFWYPPPELAATQKQQAGEDVPMVDTGDSEAAAQQQAGPGLQLGGAMHRMHPVCERYDEQIVEDIVYDIIDEISFWNQDGRKVIDRTGLDNKVGVVPGAREEIKELVQDD